jgi:hypothetical protein
MSVTVEGTNPNPNPAGEVASEEDVRNTLAELQKKHSILERDYSAERTARTAAEIERDNERNARALAEREREAAANRVGSESEARWNAEKAATTQAITAREQAIQAAEEDYARHAELGDWKEAGKAQRAMATAAAELERYKQKNELLDSNKDRMIQKPAPRQEQRPAQVAQNPIQQQNQVPSRYAGVVDRLVGGEEAYLDARPKFLSDPAYRQEVIDASNIASKRFPRGSDGYLKEISRIMGEDDGDGGRQQEQQQRQQQVANTRQSSASADLPASRRAAPGEQPSGGRGEFTLSQDEADMADSIYGDPTQRDFYIADRGKRLEHYYNMKQRAASR